MAPNRHDVIITALRHAAQEWANDDLAMAERLCTVVWDRVEATHYEFVDNEEIDR